MDSAVEPQNDENTFCHHATLDQVQGMLDRMIHRMRDHKQMDSAIVSRNDGIENRSEGYYLN